MDRLSEATFADYVLSNAPMVRFLSTGIANIENMGGEAICRIRFFSVGYGERATKSYDRALFCFFPVDRMVGQAGLIR
jgi:hypothetical protein